MKRLLFLCLLLVGCQVPQPVPKALDPVPPLAQATRGSLSFKLLWPKREIQLIPLSAQTIRIRVLKNGTLRYEHALPRPAGDGTALVGEASLPLDAESGLTVLAEAFRSAPVIPSDQPIATASASGVDVVANQKTSVVLNLAPAFTPTLTGFSPTNGGPGVEVTLSGSFGDSQYHGIGIGGVTGPGRASGSAVVANVPDGALTGPVTAFADGVSSPPGATFRVLKALNFDPASKSFQVGDTFEFGVASGTDTNDQAVGNPTITRWEVIDPAQLNAAFPAPSQVGTITSKGEFTAQAAGTTLIRVWSGSVAAMATITVDP